MGIRRGVIPFSKSIIPKLNIIAWLEYDLVYFEAVVQHFSHYTTEMPSYFTSVKSMKGQIELLTSTRVLNVTVIFEMESTT